MMGHREFRKLQERIKERGLSSFWDLGQPVLLFVRVALVEDY